MGGSADGAAEHARTQRRAEVSSKAISRTVHHVASEVLRDLESIARYIGILKTGGRVNESSDDRLAWDRCMQESVHIERLE